MGQEWDIQSEEYYESPSRYSLVNCDVCEERVSSRNVHLMDSFQHPEETLVVCGRCLGKLKDGEITE